MSWVWSSWQEYVSWVHPVVLDSPGVLRVAQQESSFNRWRRFFGAVGEFRDCLDRLREFDYAGPLGNELLRLVEVAVDSGETVLLLHKPLAQSDHSYGFLHSHDVLDHWERYAQSGRIAREVKRFIDDADDLISGLQGLAREDEDLLLSQLRVPENLESDFRLARDLFSVGFDEVGLFVAGRGLETVLREIARKRKVEVKVRDRLEPAADLDFADLVACLYRLKWRVGRTRVMSREVKALLDYLRAIRNAGAHPASTLGTGPRDVATVIAKTATRLWDEIARSRSRLDTRVVQKTW